MLRLSEIALLLIPFAVFVVWRISGGGRQPPASVVVATGLSLVLFGAVLGWYGLGRVLPKNAAYVPARIGATGQIIGPEGGK